MVAVRDTLTRPRKSPPTEAESTLWEVGYSPHHVSARQLRSADNPFVASRCFPQIMTPAAGSEDRVASSV